MMNTTLFRLWWSNFPVRRNLGTESHNHDSTSRSTARHRQGKFHASARKRRSYKGVIPLSANKHDRCPFYYECVNWHLYRDSTPIYATLTVAAKSSVNLCNSGWRGLYKANQWLSTCMPLRNLGLTQQLPDILAISQWIIYHAGGAQAQSRAAAVLPWSSLSEAQCRKSTK